MSWQVFVRPEAEAEISEAIAWYQDNSPPSALAFIEQFRNALMKLSENPYQYQVIGADIRRAPLGRFPYGLLYALAGDAVLVLSCFHGRRDPALWRGRFER
jgi:plasmid stabilization system protein ParE